MYAREENGKIVADVPNKLLQRDLNILVDLGQGLERHTECRTAFEVMAADMPSDYEFIDNTQNVSPSVPGGVTSWNDLKDKPFGEFEETVDIVSECCPPKTDDGFVGSYLNSPTIGEMYTVTYNGMDYISIANEFNGFVAIGNMSDFGGEDTGEPFLIAMTNGIFMLQSFDDAQEVTLRITGKSKGIKKLDEAYYNAPCVYYTRLTSAEKNFYHDTTCFQKVTRDELLRAKGRLILLVDPYGTQLQVVEVQYNAGESQNLGRVYCYYNRDYIYRDAE